MCVSRFLSAIAKKGIKCYSADQYHLVDKKCINAEVGIFFSRLVLIPQSLRSCDVRMKISTSVLEEQPSIDVSATMNDFI